MKKIFTLLLLTGILKGQAQGYQPLLADSITEFNVVPLYIPIRIQSSNCISGQPGMHLAVNDSLYKGNTYKKFYQYSQSNYMGLMREDTAARKVYFIPYCDTAETLLYDFSLTQGSTMNYTFQMSGGYVSSGTFMVDSIRLRHDYHTYRRHFYLRNHSDSPTSILEMIEGVGNVNHPLFLYYYFGPGILQWQPGTQNCPGSQFDEVLSCKWDNGTRAYYDSCTYALALANNCVGVSDTCNYNTICSAVQEFNGIKNISVFPNPASDVAELVIEADKQTDLTFSMVNQLGIEVKKETMHQLIKGKNYFKISVKDVSPGFYLIRVSDGVKSVGKPVLVNH